MIPIRQHEAELRAMMERAGLVPQPTGFSDFTNARDADGEIKVMMLCFTRVVRAIFWPSVLGRADSITAEHPDPRVALRHCLEMAGLLTDRPPQTDAELIAWLTERHGAGDVHQRWFSDSHGARLVCGMWEYWALDRYGCHLLTARELGAILWCAERFGEVAP
jgi:hypothetical protein